VRILYHGRVDRRKGALDLIDALALVAARGVPFRATVSGIGPDLDATRERAAAHGFDADPVRFTGYADYEAAPALYRDADVFASPTYAEGFSNTVLEAMASGLAILSCRAVGVVDCLRDGDTALLTEPGDIPAIADGLERLIRDTALRTGLARAALPIAAPPIPGRRSASASWPCTTAWPGSRPTSLPAGPADDPLPLPGGAAPPVIALALSPHLDDAAFSCGGTLARLAEAGWRVVVATLFTRSVPDPTGFALACQLDKGLGPEVDYMALRRAEDRDAMRALGAEARWLDLPEAPHRRYGSRPSCSRRTGRTTRRSWRRSRNGSPASSTSSRRTSSSRRRRSAAMSTTSSSCALWRASRLPARSCGGATSRIRLARSSRWSPSRPRWRPCRKRR
jgi:hypothetical protein